jgi:hypothetical protein
LTTVIWVWFQVLGFHTVSVALWQLTQFAVVGKWVLFLPVAEVPLWQVVHTVAAV